MIFKKGDLVEFGKKRERSGHPIFGIVEYIDDRKETAEICFGEGDNRHSFHKLADLSLVTPPAPCEIKSETLPPIFADVAPDGEILKVYSDKQDSGRWCASRYCQDHGVPEDITFGCAQIDWTIMRKLGYRTLPIVVSVKRNSDAV